MPDDEGVASVSSVLAQCVVGTLSLISRVRRPSLQRSSCAAAFRTLQSPPAATDEYTVCSQRASSQRADSR